MKVQQQNNLNHSSAGSCLFSPWVCPFCWLMPGEPKEGFKKPQRVYPSPQSDGADQLS